MRKIARRGFIKGAGSLMLAHGCLAARAETSWPTKPVRFIVPLAAGGALDFAARQCSAILSRMLSQQIFVENRTGAGGTIGMDDAMKAAPDGTTFLFANDNAAIAPHILSLFVARATRRSLRPASFASLEVTDQKTVIRSVSRVQPIPIWSGEKLLSGVRRQSEPRQCFFDARCHRIVCDFDRGTQKLHARTEARGQAIRVNRPDGGRIVEVTKANEPGKILQRKVNWAARVAYLIQ